MATTTITQTGRSTLLRRALQANAIFSGVGGLAATAGAGPLSVALGLPVPLLIGVGLCLLPYAVLLWRAAMQPEINRRLARTAIVLDTLWVLDSAALLALGLLPLTSAGWWTVLVVALIVADIAAAQYLGLRRAR